MFHLAKIEELIFVFLIQRRIGLKNFINGFFGLEFFDLLQHRFIGSGKVMDNPVTETDVFLYFFPDGGRGTGCSDDDNAVRANAFLEKVTLNFEYDIATDRDKYDTRSEEHTSELQSQ